MLEREQLLSQVVNHEILLTDRLKVAINDRDGSWFDVHGRYFNPTDYVYSVTMDGIGNRKKPDLVATRAIVAHYLGLARFPATFYQEHKFEDPNPTEKDRLLYCDYIEFQLSITGLLNVQEIQQIRDRGWWDQQIESIPSNLLFHKDVEPPSFREACNRILLWKKEGWRIALFHGAFDPVTITHLQNATTAHFYSLVTGVPMKHVVGFDSDELIKRKGANRPRYLLDHRRQQFGRFWMVDETVVLQAKKPDTNEIIKDYSDLGIDYIVITRGQEDMDTKSEAIFESKLETIIIPESPLPNATDILKKAR